MTRLLSCLHSPRWDNPNFLFRNIAAWGMCERHDSNIMISAPRYLVICPHIGVHTAQPPGGRLSDDPGHQIGRHALPAVTSNNSDDPSHYLMSVSPPASGESSDNPHIKSVISLQLAAHGSCL